MARKLLDIPDRFTWATNASRTITPAQASGIVIADGWDFSDRPPARLMNYFHSLQYQWADKQIIQLLANPTFDATFHGTAVATIAKNDNNGLWIRSSATTGATATSYDGWVWSAGAGLAGTPVYNCCVNTATDGIVIGVGAGIEYSADAAVWSTAGVGLTVAMANVQTSDLFLRIRTSTIMERWLTGATGGATLPSVTSWGATGLKTVAGDTASNWVTIDANGNCHLSTDGGDNWAQSGQGPVDAIASFIAVDCDYEDGTIVVVGEDGSVPQIARSTDDGANWSTVSFTPQTPTGGTTQWNAVRALGNDIWLAVGELGTGVNGAVDYWYSIDDGATWSIARVRWDGTINTNFRTIWCDGNQFVSSGVGGDYLRSDTIGLA